MEYWWQATPGKYAVKIPQRNLRGIKKQYCFLQETVWLRSCRFLFYLFFSRTNTPLTNRAIACKIMLSTNRGGSYGAVYGILAGRSQYCGVFPDVAGQTESQTQGRAADSGADALSLRAAGMWIFRHKTKHWYFVWGMPGILILQLVLAWLLVRRG